MEWNEKLQQIIDYVEEHLQRSEEPIDPDEIAAAAGCAYSFFQKVFSYMNGISFAGYVRARKLTLAGYELKSTAVKVVDLSYKYGYDSPTSFTKAFQEFHGVSPTQARNADAPLQVFPKMQVVQNLKTVWRLEQKPAQRLVGKIARIPRETALQEIPAFWSVCQRDGTFAALAAMGRGQPNGMFGLFLNDGEPAAEMEYAVMVCTDAEVPEGYFVYHLPAETWAVFDCRGRMPHAIQQGWGFLTGEWLVQYPFAHADCPELEWYSNGNPYSEDYLSQIWIPVLPGN